MYPVNSLYMMLGQVLDKLSSQTLELVLSFFKRDYSTSMFQKKNMINQVVWIWQYQEPETNKCRKSRRQK